jgi:hypothetical protein
MEYRDDLIAEHDRLTLFGAHGTLTREEARRLRLIRCLLASRDVPRIPPTPESLVGALQDRVHKDIDTARPARSGHHVLQRYGMSQPDAVTQERTLRYNLDALEIEWGR